MIKKIINEPPGTLNYTGKFKDGELIVDYIIYDENSFERKTCRTIKDVPENNKIHWINIIGLHDIEQIKIIGEKFNIHNIDLEDVVHVSQRSKIEEKDHYLFSLFKMVYLKSKKIIHEHVSIIIVENYLITFQETPGDVFDSIRIRLKNSIGGIRKRDINYLYYAIVDSLVDQYFDILSYISNRFNELETSIIDENITNMDDVYKLRKELLYIKNAVLPIKDALNAFVKKEGAYFNKEINLYYINVREHLDQIQDNIIIYREMVNSLYEMQMSNASNDMNKTMMTLTIFSAIFIPLSFLAGVFGMNFKYMPGLGFNFAFYYFIFGCLIIAFSMLYYFKRKKWF